METSGFYMYDSELYYAPNRVTSSQFELHRDLKDTYTYPAHDWYWFDSNADARTFFNLILTPETQPQ